MDKKIKSAFDFASNAHKDQKYDEYPYDKHLKDVFEIVSSYCDIDEDLLISSILHDVIEDTDYDFMDIKNQFGEKVAVNVWCVTKESNIDHNFEFRSKMISNLLTYQKIKTNPDAIIIKLADRIANLEHCIKQQSTSEYFLNKYMDENPHFKHNLLLNNNYLWSRYDRAIKNVSDILSSNKV